MLPGLIFLFLGCLFGFVLLRVNKASLRLEEQIIWGIPLGIMLLTLWCFIWAVIVRYQDWAIIGASASAAAFVFYYLNLDIFRKAIRHDWLTTKKEWQHGDTISWGLVLLPWLLYSVATIPFLLFYNHGDLVAGWINVWGDWAVHLRTSTFFAQHTKLTLESPIFSGTLFHYPYMTSYLSAILQRLGTGLDQSLIWPTYLLFGSLPAILYSLGRHFTKRRDASVLFVYLFLLAGGMGVWFLLKDLAAGHYFWEASAYSPKLYTDVRDNGTSVNTGIWFMNFIMSEFFPQRAFLAGIPIALFILQSLWSVVSPESTVGNKPLGADQKSRLLFISILYGLLPLVHTHSFIAISVIAPVFVLWRFFSPEPSNKLFSRGAVELLAYFFGPAVIIGSLVVFLFVFDFNSTQSFAHAIKWWQPNQQAPLDNPLIYWLRNAGPILILGIISFFYKESRRLLPLLISGLIIFIITNFVSFQPWHYDNLKLLTYWYLLWALPVAVMIVSLRRWLLPLQIILVVLLTGAGLADSLMVTSSARSGGIRMNTAADLAFAKAVQEYTAKDEDGMIIAATNHDNPLSLTSGRQLYMGYEGWLWTYGVNYSERLGELKDMYALNERGLELIKAKHVHYIALGPQERNAYEPNEAALLSRFVVVIDLGQYKLLRVN